MSAENRPPTLGSARKWRYPASCAHCASGEPGSVTMQMRSAGSMPSCSNAAMNARRCESVSTVEPDFDDTTTAVCSRSDSSTSATCSGLVESRTSSSIWAVRAITSGASDEPPIPHSTIRVTPFARNSSRAAVICAISGCDTSWAAVQPSRLLDSSTAASPHSVASCANSREANCSATS